MHAELWNYERAFETADHVITHPNPSAVSLSVRASALVFSDPRSQELLSLIEKIAASNATALIIGETGTGKELIARHIHALSNRRDGPFQAINCGAFSETLVESELFGYERGAFTGATSAKTGWFESANGGTLFLDEIGDLPQSTQVKLLRVLQEREVVRLGSRKATPIDVRLIAATNVDLEEAVRAGRFREDLYYRIKVVPIALPPLRERPGDILPLVEHFLNVYKSRLHTGIPKLAPETIQQLLHYPWPGNIRELENVIHRALLISTSETLYPKDLGLPPIGTVPLEKQDTKSAWAINQDTKLEATDSSTPHPATETYQLERVFSQLFESPPPKLFELVNAVLVEKAYEFSNKNQVHTARLLGISRNILRARLKELKLIA
ncbi:sigma-54 interaction domain-containing protein [Methylobacillus flagellatus]|uniref:Sigma-54 factor, interaction region n=1 Tax=Methylobacillus flagellatus (strain ATCC 51484 / DSM 6875 / VKM B-1610 / KT) TaxID=265072 RepID=Q1H102_METFK|nr:sigma 54-interacting transcriptional regulator [Methylobacillus flagellatus]ABE49835.1 sigma-54 factor, interaction region [Methylobacillus flagellatus KT]